MLNGLRRRELLRLGQSRRRSARLSVVESGARRIALMRHRARASLHAGRGGFGRGDGLPCFDSTSAGGSAAAFTLFSRRRPTLENSSLLSLFIFLVCLKFEIMASRKVIVVSDSDGDDDNVNVWHHMELTKSQQCEATPAYVGPPKHAKELIRQFYHISSAQDPFVASKKAPARTATSASNPKPSKPSWRDQSTPCDECNSFACFEFIATFFHHFRIRAPTSIPR